MSPRATAALRLVAVVIAIPSTKFELTITFPATMIPIERGPVRGNPAVGRRVYT
jgi:hypothetical protein